MSDAANDPLRPSTSLLAKLGSALVHVDETIYDGHDFDVHALKAILRDREVEVWMEQMDDLALLPKKRNG